MEKEINIAEILKDKPQGTKLYDLLYNVDVELDTISTTDTETVVWCTNETDNNTTCHRGYSEFGTIRGCPDGLQILLPSKEMRDWHKFAWKKGDVLESDNKLKRCIFKEWANDDYTDFNCFAMDEGWNDYFGKINISTFEYHKADDFVTQLHIKRVEKKFGGKLNLETLEIEKQHEFKDGDIVVVDKNEEMNLAKIIAIYNDGDTLLGFNSYAYLNVSLEKLNFCSEVLACGRTPRLASEEENQQLFDALAKEGKRWNPDTKLFEDLPKKCEFKPFQKVLAKFDEDCEWVPDFFYHYDKSDSEMPYVCIANGRAIECIPYNEETKHLLGTADEWKGGE